MSKPIIEWLRELDEPWQTQLITNAINQRAEDNPNHMVECRPIETYQAISITEAINYACVWDQTPEGWDYWNNLHTAYRRRVEAAEDERQREEEKQREEELEKRRAEIEARKVSYSTSLHQLLMSLRGSGNAVATLLLDQTSTTNEFGNYITTRGSMFSYLPNGREHKVNEETGRWLRDGRQEMRPAKLARKLITEKAISSYLTDADFEKFANQVKAYLSIVGDEDGEGKSLTFKIVSGEEIRDKYHERNYSDVMGKGSNLWGSCMRYDGCKDYFNIYVQNPNKISLLVAEDTEGKVLGRALLWNFDDGTKGMDTIYASDSVIEAMKDWAMDHDYIFKASQSCHHESFDRNADGYNDNMYKTTTLDKYEFDYYPYMDTMRFLSSNGKITNEWCRHTVDKTLRSTGGRWEEYENDEDDDDRVELENGDFCDQDDAIHLDYVAYDGTRRRGYYHYEECVTTARDDWYHEDDATQIGGRWYAKDDSDLVWVEEIDDYALMDDTVMCEVYGHAILTDNAVQMEDGDYIHKDEAELCVFDRQWHRRTDMTELTNGDWVYDEEAYYEHLKQKENEEARESIVA
jgi:hypothetical protein